jgi:hypothetical protein
MVLNEVKRLVPSRLGWLDACDCLPGIPVDTSAVPPRPNLGAKAADYDGVVCLVYEYAGGRVVLHMHLVDSKTGQQAWYHKLDTKDDDVAGRLRRHGFWTPTTIKTRCYRHK